MESKQTLLFRLYQILCEYSDEEHPLTQQRIIELLERDFGLVVERKAVGRNMSYLKEMGYNIRSDKRGSYIEDRPFENSELRILIDSVLGSSHISAVHSGQLIDKLIAAGGHNFKAHVKHVYSVKDWNKTKNPDLFLNIDIVDEAIENEKQIYFDYNKMGVDKKLRKIACHVVSPYQMVLHNQHYYLMARDEKWKDVSFYRMDKITGMRIIDESRTPIKTVEGYKNGIDYKVISTCRPYMYADAPVHIVIRADEKSIDDIIDWFGDEIRVKPHENGMITVDLVASPEAMKHWAMQYGSNAEVLSPESLRNTIRETIIKMQEKYQRSDAECHK